MKSIVGILSGAVFVAMSFNQVLATESMHSSMMKPTCPAGDTLVSVDMKTKMYAPADKGHMMMTGTHTGSSMSSSMKSDKQTMCKSKADAMGAHMMKAKAHM